MKSETHWTPATLQDLCKPLKRKEVLGSDPDYLMGVRPPLNSSREDRQYTGVTVQILVGNFSSGEEAY